MYTINIRIKVTDDTIAHYLDYFTNAFLINRAVRYDVKGRKYIGSPYKYYFKDIGLRNVRLNFRQNEENNIMENILYNELCLRGSDVDIGIVEWNTKTKKEKAKRAISKSISSPMIEAGNTISSPVSQ